MRRLKEGAVKLQAPVRRPCGATPPSQQYHPPRAGTRVYVVKA
jgi:hypothetical protein